MLHCKLRKWGVTRAIVFATCNATFVALHVAGYIVSCNMAFSLVAQFCCDKMNPSHGAGGGGRGGKVKYKRDVGFRWKI